MKEFNDLMTGMNKIVNPARKKTKGSPKDSTKDASKDSNGFLALKGAQLEEHVNDKFLNK